MDSLRIIADKVSLPADTTTVPLVQTLPPQLRQLYSHPDPSLFRPPTRAPSGQSAKLVGSRQNYAAFVLRLLQAEMVEFTVKPLCVNGVFAVSKPDGSQRFIVDARPANEVFADPPGMQLPTPDVLSKLQVTAGVPVHSAKADIDNCFHRYSTPKWLRPYLCLPPVRAEDVGLDHLYGRGTLIWPQCTTLPMGWSHSAALVQACNVHTLTSLPSFPRADLITADGDFRLDRPRFLVYIDDFVIFGLDSAALSRLLDEYIAAMNAIGLLVKPSKIVRPTPHGMDVLGLHFDGVAHTLGVHPRKLFGLVHRTSALLRRGECTGKDLSRLIGSWTWAALVQRPAFSVFSAVYRFIEVAGSKVFQLRRWPTVLRELRIISGLAPLLIARLDAPFAAEIFAFDASSDGEGVTTAAVCAFAQQQMALVRLPIGKPPTCIPPTLAHVRWRVVVAAPFLRPEHINVLEARAALTAVRRAATRPSLVGCRHIGWSDSLVVSAAVNKGRSSSFQLLARLRSIAAVLLATRMTLQLNWVPTKHNPADEPSRRFKRSRPRPLFGSQLTKAYSSNDLGDGPSFIQQAAHLPKTRKRYKAAVRRFLRFVSRHALPVRTTDELDIAMNSFLHDLFIRHDGKRKSTGQCAISGIRMLKPEWNPLFGRSRLTLKGWSRLVPTVSYPPLSWGLAVCIASVLAQAGRFDMGVAVLLLFDCYLRAGELIALRAGDVGDYGDARIGPGHRQMCLHLRNCKTGKNQSVTVCRTEVKRLLRVVVAGKSPDQPLFPFCAKTLLVWFRAACKLLGLTANYVLHSGRHGGATHDYINGKSVDDVLLRGRWASTKSARIYIQSGRGLLLAQELPDNVKQLIPVLLKDVFSALFAHNDTPAPSTPARSRPTPAVPTPPVTPASPFSPQRPSSRSAPAPNPAPLYSRQRPPLHPVGLATLAPRRSSLILRCRGCTKCTWVSRYLLSMTSRFYTRSCI
jgi:integrase